MRVKARAYASSANLGPGFDALAVALNALYDEVEAWLDPEARVEVVEVVGPYSHGVPRSGNSAAAAVQKLLELLGMENVGIKMRVWKGVPPGKGLGSSGASAAAAVVAAARLLGVEPDVSTMLLAAGAGEAAAAGSPHYDNVAASLLGGLAIVAVIDGTPIAISTGINAYFAVGIPLGEPPKGKTGIMRGLLPRTIGFSEAVSHWQRLSLMVASLVRGDYELAGRAMYDEIVEPRREGLVPCYRIVRKTALEAGALGAAISGAGPSIIAMARSRPDASSIAEAMAKAYKECGVEAEVLVSEAGKKAGIVWED